MKVVVTAGGTAGHISPALAVAGELRTRGVEVFFAGRPESLEARLAGQAGLTFLRFRARGFNRQRPWTLLTSTLRIARSRRAARIWLTTAGVDAVAAFGGFASLPMAMAANQLGLPLLIQEQNATPGLANRQLARAATLVALADAAARSGFPESARVVVTGNPLRAELFGREPAAARLSFGLDAQALTLLVFGGSLGAQHINTALLAVGPELLQAFPNLQILQICGEKNYAEMSQGLTALGAAPTRWRLLAYCDDMGQAYAAADLVLARAGATTLAELSALGKAAILVPYPFAAADEQSRNAERLAAAGAATVIADADLDRSVFRQSLEALLTDAAGRQQMAAAARQLGARDAGARTQIADLICELASSRGTD